VHDPAPSDLTVKATDFLYNMQLTDLLYGLYFGTEVIYSFGLYKNVMMGVNHKQKSIPVSGSGTTTG
jgi:hypothetical protein